MKKITALLIIANFGVSSFAQTSFSDSIIHEGDYRDYIIYIPGIYDGSEAVPLLLNLHGYGSNSFEQLYYADFKPIADTANFIMVLPNGSFDPFFPSARFWNCFIADDIGVDDVQFLSNLIDTISANYNIDQNRVYSTGMSNGGFMSYTLAGELSNKIAAVASVTGSIDKDRFAAYDPQHPTPVMEIHGTGDFVVPYDGSFDFKPIEEVIDYWISINNCNPDPEIIPVENTSTTDGCTAEHYIYSGGDNEANVELFKVIGGGHTWPGTAFFYFDVTNLDFNASKEIWNFFTRYSLDVLTGNEEIVLESISGVNLYPNPFTEKVVIHGKADQITILDITGREVYLQKGNSIEQVEILTDNWKAGTYVLKILIDGKFSSQLITKVSE
ncbi:MAG: T9SS type A sorting domain-containing protein [Chitinophagales bacterium]